MNNFFTIDRLTTVASWLIAAALATIVFGAGYIIYNHYSGNTQGVVYSKSYIYASCSTTVTTNTQMHTVTTNNTCYPDRYGVWFEKDGRKNYASVPKSTWDEIKINDYFDSNCMCKIPQ